MSWDDDVVYVGNEDQANTVSDEDDCDDSDYGCDEDYTMGSPAGESEAGI
jgi:hypothetical protein